MKKNLDSSKTLFGITLGDFKKIREMITLDHTQTILTIAKLQGIDIDKIEAGLKTGTLPNEKEADTLANIVLTLAAGYALCTKDWSPKLTNIKN